ncbi:MAG: DNA double-strand break repair ATPase Rad50 [Archaeoglobaceae archaeon]|nr:DNA double-strand break repair ATPase Rad50 [Archaeoglobaceae archaeon]
MILKELIIRNFKSHSNTKIRFEKGINLIVGRNGAGKSSILEAILVALYGVRPPMRKDDLMQLGASEYLVDLILDFNNKEYRITRRSSGNSELKSDFFLEGDKRINEWVEKNISPFHVFTGAIYVRQGEIEAIISDETGRERIIRKITRIEDYENAWKNLGQIIRELESEMKKYLETLKQKDECERRLKEKSEEIEKTKKEIYESEKRLEKLKEEIKIVLGEKRRLDSIKEEIVRRRENTLKLEGEIKGLKNKLDVLKKQKKELETKREEIEKRFEKLVSLEKKAMSYIELENLHRNFLKTSQEIDSKLKNLEIERERFLNEIKRCEEEKSNLEKINEELIVLRKRIEILKPEVEKWEQIKSKVDRKVQIEKILSEKGYSAEKIDQMFLVIQKAREKDRSLKEEFSKVSMEKGFLVSEEKRLEEVLEKLKSLKGICPVCERELNEVHREELLKKYFSEIEKIKIRILKVEEKEKKLGEERKRVEEILGKQDIVLKYKQLVDEMRKILEVIRGLEVEKLKDASLEMEKIISRIEFLEDAAKKVKEIADKHEEVEKRLEYIEKNLLELEKDRKINKSKLEELGFSSIEELEKTMKDFRSAYEEWTSLKSSESELKELKIRIASIEDEIEKNSMVYEQKISEFEKEKEKMEFLENEYDERKHMDLEIKEQEILKEIAGIEERLGVLRRALEVWMRDRDYLLKQLQMISESERKFRAIESAIPELEKIRDKFLSYKNLLAEAALKEVEKNASEIFEEFTDGKYSGIKLKRVFEYGKEKLKVFVLHQGEERDTGFLSGGELIALGIAFRLALSMFEARGRIPLLILDEPTPFLDEDRRRKLVDITMDYLRKIPQVIIVSHDEELKDAADKVIFVEYRGGVSFVEG